jgi:hypothetical protein
VNVRINYNLVRIDLKQLCKRYWNNLEEQKKKKRKEIKKSEKAEGNHSGPVLISASAHFGLFQKGIPLSPFSRWRPGATCHPSPPLQELLPKHGSLPGRPISTPEPNPSPSAKTEPTINSLGSPPLSPFHFPRTSRIDATELLVGSPQPLRASPSEFAAVGQPCHLSSLLLSSTPSGASPNAPRSFCSTAKPQSRCIPDAPAPPAAAPRKPRTRLTSTTMPLDSSR